MVKVAHHQAVEYALALQSPSAVLALVVLLVANAGKYLFGLIQKSGQRALDGSGLLFVAQGQLLAHTFDSVDGGWRLGDSLEGVGCAWPAFLPCVLLIGKHGFSIGLCGLKLGDFADCHIVEYVAVVLVYGVFKHYGYLFVTLEFQIGLCA